VEGVDRAAHGVVIGGRLDERPHRSGVAGEPDEQAVGYPLHERTRRALDGLEPRRLDVARKHRSGLVGDEHDRGALEGHRHRCLRSGQRDGERDGGRREQGGGQAAPPGGSGRGDAADDGRRRVADRELPSPTALDRPEQGSDRHEEQGGEAQGLGEAHRVLRPSSRNQSVAVERTT
jgi:hypothetical protein